MLNRNYDHEFSGKPDPAFRLPPGSFAKALALIAAARRAQAIRDADAAFLRSLKIAP